MTSAAPSEPIVKPSDLRVGLLRCAEQKKLLEKILEEKIPNYSILAAMDKMQGTKLSGNLYDDICQWKSISVKRHESASESIIVFAERENVPIVAKIFFPYDSINVEMAKALESETYIYQVSVNYLLRNNHTPCLVRPLGVLSASIKPYILKKILSFQSQDNEERVDEAFSRLLPSSTDLDLEIRVNAQITERITGGMSLLDAMVTDDLSKTLGVPEHELPSILDSITFQLFWTLEQLHRVCVVHNDLQNPRNVFLEKLPVAISEEYIFVDPDDAQKTIHLLFETKWRVMFYDWDRSSVVTPPASHPLGEKVKRQKMGEAPSSPLIESDQCCITGSCRVPRRDRDYYHILMNISKIPSPDDWHEDFRSSIPNLMPEFYDVYGSLQAEDVYNAQVQLNIYWPVNRKNYYPTTAKVLPLEGYLKKHFSKYLITPSSVTDPNVDVYTALCPQYTQLCDEAVKITLKNRSTLQQVCDR